jgi:predicted Fe-S protein YdhL (DUF1289 family)
LKNNNIIDDEYARVRAGIRRSGDRSQFPLSPCVLLCTLDAQQRCLGCSRTLDQIKRWSLMSIDEQWAVIDLLVARDTDV